MKVTVRHYPLWQALSQRKSFSSYATVYGNLTKGHTSSVDIGPLVLTLFIDKYINFTVERRVKIYSLTCTCLVLYMLVKLGDSDGFSTSRTFSKVSFRFTFRQ